MEEQPVEVHGVQTTMIKQQDVLRIGTPGKGGSIDVHGDMDDLEGFMRKIDNAKILLRYARQELE